MIIGVGIDIIEIERIANDIKKYGKRFLNRCFTPFEQERAQKHANPESFYAKRWAAKEAMVKALGTGFVKAMKITDIEVYSFEQGQPQIRLSGETQKMLRYLSRSPKIHLSLSDNLTMATAIVVIDDATK